METGLTLHPSPSDALVASSTALSFRTGNAPGSARHTGHVLTLGAAPKSVEQPQNAFVRVLSCTGRSSPTTISNRSRLIGEPQRRAPLPERRQRGTSCI